MDRQRALGGLAPWIEVAKPGQVEVVIGMHVADDHRGQVERIEHVLEGSDDALADVEQDGRVFPFDQEAGGRRIEVRGGAGVAEHGEPEAG